MLSVEGNFLTGHPRERKGTEQVLPEVWVLTRLHLLLLLGSGLSGGEAGLQKTYLSTGGGFDGVGIHWHRVCPRHRLYHGHRLSLSQPQGLHLSYLCPCWLQSQKRRIRNDCAAG